MKIIGHRGAPALALENTLASFKKAIDAGVDAIELDVHATKDGQLVVVHDPTLARISDSGKRIDELTYSELRRIKLRDGSHVPLLRDVLKSTGDTEVLVEIKEHNLEKEIVKVLDEFPHQRFYIGSFKRDVVASLHQLRPGIPVAIATNTKPLRTIRSAKREGYNGVVMHHIYLPIAYDMARRAGLDVFVFPVGTTWILRYIARFWPGVWRTAWAALLLERRNWNFWDSKFVQWWCRRYFPDVRVCADHPERWTGKQL